MATAADLAEMIVLYWRARGYHEIKVKVLEECIKSNIGPLGFPPKTEGK